MQSKENNFSLENGFHTGRSRLTAFLMLLISVLALYVSLAGILKESIYKDVLSAGTITEFMLAGSVAQDIISVPLALLLILLSVWFLFRPGYKIFISMIGLAGYFFYGYGIYAIHGQYTSLYMIYLILFGLSIYSIIFGLLSFREEQMKKTFLPKTLGRLISIFLYGIAGMLGLVWIIRLVPDLSSHIPQATYGVFVLDLGIVFPAIAITATLLIKNRPFGNILAGVALIKAVTVCLSWGFAEVYTRLCGLNQGGYDMLLFPAVLTGISIVLYFFYINKLKCHIE